MSSSSYRTILAPGSATVVVERSRFIAYAAPARTEAEASSFVERIRKKHYDATHNVPVYIAGSSCKFSDDGEPAGTAGAPVFEMLRRENIANIAIVVTRYFGGIKLGTGGLVRAYTNAAKEALSVIGVVTNDRYERCALMYSYPLHGRIENALKTMEGVLIRETQFSDVVRLEVYVPPPEIERFEARIVDLSNAAASVERLGEQFMSVRDGEVVGEYERLLETMGGSDAS